MMPNPKLLSRAKAMALTRELMDGACPVVGGGLDGARPAVLVDASSRPDVAEVVHRCWSEGRLGRVRTMLAAQGTPDGTLLVVFVTLDDGSQAVEFKVSMRAEDWREVLDAVARNGQLTILMTWPGDNTGQNTVVEAGIDRDYLGRILSTMVGPDVESVRAQN